MQYFNWRVGTFLALGLMIALPGKAQITIPLDNDTGTQLRIEGDRVEISGGTFSGDNVNLFHSFEQFNLNQNQIADFLANPTTQNILGRIIGGDPSFVNGLIQVSNSNANLYLMNPAGIVFGAGARLNVGGDFFATTATGIGFNNNWFNNFGDNNYSDLIGNPNQFAFDLTEAGSIINNGDLQVNPNQNLTLLGGTVINTGNLTAPAGEITITAVPNSSLVRISHSDSLLSLEIEPPRNLQGQIANFTALDLPQLLTATPTDFNLNLTSNSAGNIQLDNTIIPNETGVAIASGNLDVSGTTGGSINVLGNKVAIISGNLNASGENSGGNIRVGGDFRGQGSIPNATRTVVNSNSILNANALQNGNGGRAIIWSDEATGFSGNISATGGQFSGDGGFVEISGKQDLNFNGQVDITAFQGKAGTLLLDPENIRIVTVGSDDAELGDNQILAGDRPGNTLFISVGFLNGLTGDVILEATNNITIDPGISLSFSALDSISFKADSDLNNAGDFVMDTTQNITTNGKDITIEGHNITTGSINTSNTGGNGGEIELTATGNITTGDINTSASGFPSGVALEGGEVEITAAGSVITGDITTIATASPPVTPLLPPTEVEGGDVNIEAGSSIVTGTINTSAEFQTPALTPLTNFSDSIEGGDVTLESGSQPGSNIIFSSITTTAEEQNTGSTADISGGDVEILANGLVRGTGLNTNSSTIDTRAILSTTTLPNDSGNVTIQHDGGFGNVPFIVGDSAVASDPNRNGTVGEINAGNGTPLLSGTFPVAPNGNTVNPRPNIRISSINSPPVVAVIEPIVIAPQLGQNSASFSFNQLASQVSDVNLDNTIITGANNTFSIFIDEITTIGTVILLRNNAETVLPPGSSLVLEPGDSLRYEPPENFFGSVNVFRLSANDNVAIASPQVVTVNVRENIDYDGYILENEDLEIDDPFGFNNNPENRVLLDAIETIEEEYSSDYTDYFDIPEVPTVSVDEAREILRGIEQATGEKPALVYVLFSPTQANNLVSESSKVQSQNANESQEIWQFSAMGLGETAQTSSPSNRLSNPNDILELLLITPDEKPLRVPMRGVTRSQMMGVAENFRRTVTNASRPTAYQEPAQQLYEWIIAPLKAEMERQEITNIGFILAPGLRSLPVAALYDGEEFLIEQYSVGLMPSLSLTDTRYQDVKNMSVLAMGAAEFTQLQPLPAVPLELNIVTEQIWPGEAFLNEQFTLSNLQAARSRTPYGIVHLATHAEFNPGTPENSYIQFWGDSQLHLSRLRELGFNDPVVELLVLSACRTALGNETAELGFTGLAVQAGVKSGLGSLWYVSDTGTLALMSAFYEALQSAPIKAEAVRQAQLALLRGEARFEEGSLISRGLTVPLTPDLTLASDRALTHPYYWSGFTLVGSPW